MTTIQAIHLIIVIVAFLIVVSLIFGTFLSRYIKFKKLEKEVEEMFKVRKEIVEKTVNPGEEKSDEKTDK